jgi:hypothetical protein
MPLTEAEGEAWRVAVRRSVDDEIRRKAAVAAVTPECVRAWFPDDGRPSGGPDLDEFVSALRVLSVTTALSNSEMNNITPERKETADFFGELKKAIDKCAVDLPKFLNKISAGTIPFYSDGDLHKLFILSETALDASGIVLAYEPERQAAAWHDDARLIGWHVQRLLRRSGRSNLGISATGPLVCVVQQALERVDRHRDADAISKSLTKAANAPRKGRYSTRAELESKGTHVFIA